MTNPRLIFSEIDDTLVSPDYSLNNETILAIRKQIIHGNLFIPVSNRMPKAMLNVIEKITTASPLIAYNGALVLDEMGQVLNSQFMQVDTAIKICNIVEKYPNLIWNIYSGYNWLTQDNDNPIIKKLSAYLQVKPFPTTIEHLKELKGVHKISIIGNHADLLKVQKEAFQLDNLTTVFFNNETLDILAPDVSRLKAVKIMADYFAIDLKDCIAFGGLIEDIDMLNEIGHPYLTTKLFHITKDKFHVVPQEGNYPNFAQILADFA
ncbi:Cof subfamily protein (haloacid dehalogenase superfamily) [Lactobacillus colini]|uniref:Cof subfamily protein (Haloacid dehalogenase superfamily) n=1 Tax=Lactobacillus colini TaxID=1819254 RepID=A0ABS4MFE8_9LACO|nr:HAD-IIB family hydrolase [Lactobacillus colini]MBP2058415.1 Cof subfamily protein (haloacid dehalogenase superfamily) [Lactobacillus colini]